MINEINRLSSAMRDAEITISSWHHRYGPISNIKLKAPCIQIILDGPRVARLVSVPAEKGNNIRRYGDNQGSFPAMNLTPLYRITDAKAKETITDLIANPGKSFDLAVLRSWCTSDNWTKKFLNKYRLNFDVRPQELLTMLGKKNAFPPIEELIRAVEPFRSPAELRKALEQKAFEMLENRSGVAPALQTLFYLPTPKEEEKGETGKISVVIDTEDLIDIGWSPVGPRFAKGLNHALMRADAETHPEQTQETLDAFGRSYAPLEDTMPKVKLDAGFDVTLRTMFHGQPCQFRYGKIENGSYPLSKEKRSELSAALEWLSRKERMDKTWVRLGKNEAMFVYPSRLPEEVPSLTGAFQKPTDEEAREGLFEAKAKDFAEYVTKTKALDPARYPEWIQFFVLRKLDKARSKVVYTHNAAPEDIVRRSDIWQSAAANLPTFHFGKPWIPFPLRVAGIINRVWKRDGTVLDEQHKEVAAFHGMELFFGVSESVLREDLRILVKNTSPLAVFAGQCLNRSRYQEVQGIAELQSVLALMGMLLYWTNHRKDDYMNEYPFLLGQMLKAADYLHEMYCVKVRGNDQYSLPQLIGGSLYTSAAEYPNQTLVQLLQRMKPYLNWARSNRSECVEITKKSGEKIKGPTAGYYLAVFTQIADKLHWVLKPDTRFSDAEKAQLFLGYLASFPRKEASRPRESTEDEVKTESVKGE